MNKIVVMVLSAVALVGCSSQSVDDSWTAWVCDNQQQVFWRLTDASGDKMDVRLGGEEKIRHLVNEPAGSGALYSDGELSLHSKGEQGLVYWTATDDLIGLGCKAP